MAEEFEGNLAESVFWGADLSRAHFRDVDFTGTTMTNVWLVDVDIDGLVERLVINGVDVTEYVRERDPWQPLRGMLRPTDRAGLLATWDELERAWASTIEQARRLTDAQRRESVNGEWSFLETLRHLVFAIDKWFTVPLAGGSFDPIGIPNSGSAGFPWPGLDPGADPSFDEVLSVRADRSARFRSYLETVTDDEIARQVEVLENGTASVIECLYTVFEEEFAHHRYALRDLASLG
jgi:hypothetical protein